MIRRVLMENFKCFGSQEIQLGGITVLAGLNGVGKSSVMQALLLLRQSGLDVDGNPAALRWQGDLVDVGSFDEVLYDKAEQDTIVLEASFQSPHAIYVQVARTDTGDDPIPNLLGFSGAFNELSAENHARTRSDAIDRMNHLVEAIATLAGRSAANLMSASPFDFFGMKLSEDYSLGTWLQDPSVERDQRLFLRTISTKVAFDRDVSEAIKERFLLSEFRVQGLESRGLGLSYLLGTVAVSLKSEEFWTKVRLPLQYSWLEPDESQRCMDIVALNISDYTQVRTVADELLTRKRDELSADPSYLLGSFRECFPHVRFGLDVEIQLSELPNDMLQPIIGKLIVLDGAVRDWRRASTALPSLPKVHRESERTMQAYGDMRRFRSADGKMATYEPHAMVGNRYRIHFRVDQPRKSFEIGYIGKHLPTATVPK